MDIVITTFSKRIELLKNLIIGIRNQTDNKIIIVVNGEKNGEFNNEYRKLLLEFIIGYDNIYPIFFIEIRGLCKMWNTGVIHSFSDDVLVLNDDMIVHNGFIEECENFIHLESYNGVCLINGGFSHFIVNKKTLDELNYFDERFLGFGWEDVDFSQRFINKFGEKTSFLQTNKVVNFSSKEIHDDVNITWEKYSKFNQDFSAQKYGSYGSKYFELGEEKIKTDNQYPYEKFYWEQKINLFK